MSMSYLLGVFSLFFVLFFWYQNSLTFQCELEESKYSTLESERDRLDDAEYSLRMDIERTQKLQDNMENELKREEKMFNELTDTLNAILLKVEGSERLEQAISTLETEYKKLEIESKLLEELNR